MNASPVALYRHYNAAGALLYVGISHSAIKRLSQHKSTAKWPYDAVRMDTQWFPSRQEAEAAEKTAIQKEQPLFNLKDKVDSEAPPKIKKKVRRVKYLKSGYLKFSDYTPGGQRLFLICAALFKTVTLPWTDCEFTVSTAIFNYDAKLSDENAHGALDEAAHDLMTERTIRECQGSNEDVEYRMKAHFLAFGITYYADSRIKISLRQKASDILEYLQKDEHFNHQLGLIPCLDNSGCLVGSIKKNKEEMRAKKEDEHKSWLEKINCPDDPCDGVYYCKEDCGNFIGPLCLKNKPPQCRFCGGKTFFSEKRDD
jgi:hypothetical protein